MHIVHLLHEGVREILRGNRIRHHRLRPRIPQQAPVLFVARGRQPHGFSPKVRVSGRHGDEAAVPVARQQLEREGGRRADELAAERFELKIFLVVRK